VILAGKKAVVTGGGKGIGAAVARSPLKAIAGRFGAPYISASPAAPPSAWR